jgi:hypothetical protein
MIHIDVLEELGIGMAAMSDISDGDGSSSDGCAKILEGSEDMDGDLILANQVHGIHIVRADQHSESADGIITDEPGKILGIRVADCVPIWLIDPVRKAVGLIHAGRKGTFRRIAAVGTVTMRDAYGCSPRDVIAYIGPSAGPCCYEVNEELAGEFHNAGFPVLGRHLDLWATNRQQLIEAGIQSDNIHISGHCTICTPKFYSFRKGDADDRNLCVVSIWK